MRADSTWELGYEQETWIILKQSVHRNMILDKTGKVDEVERKKREQGCEARATRIHYFGTIRERIKRPDETK